MSLTLKDLDDLRRYVEGRTVGISKDNRMVNIPTSAALDLIQMSQSFIRLGVAVPTESAKKAPKRAVSTSAPLSALKRKILECLDTPKADTDVAAVVQVDSKLAEISDSRIRTARAELVATGLVEFHSRNGTKYSNPSLWMVTEAGKKLLKDEK